MKELKQLEEILSISVTNLTKDQECASYFGFIFQLGDRNIKFRKTKVTPKKTDNSLPSGNATVKAKQSLFQLMTRCIITLLLQRTNDISVSLSSQNRP